VLLLRVAFDWDISQAVCLVCFYFGFTHNVAHIFMATMQDSIMRTITVEHKPAPVKLEVMGVYDWPLWEKDPAVFPWTYTSAETCYLLSGEVTVTPDQGQPVRLNAGDLVSFPAGLSCTWEIHRKIKKHYKLA
jgi:uncharacterized protein